MKPPRGQPQHQLQQLNLTLADASLAELPKAAAAELASALAELLLSVARTCLGPRTGDSDES